MLKTKGNSSSKWKFLVVTDDSGNETQRIEFDDNQKLKMTKTRNKKRKLNHQLKNYYNNPNPDESSENTLETKKSKLNFQMDFHEEVVFNRKNNLIVDIDAIEPNLDLLLESYSLFDHNYQSIDENTHDTESLYFSGVENFDLSVI